MTLYSILNRDAKLWWYHKRLRESGNHEEARKRERESIKSHLRILRQVKADGGYAIVGYTGSGTFCYKNGHLSGCTAEFTMSAARAAGILLIDCRTADYSKLVKRAISGPMPSCDKSRCVPVETAGPFDYITVEDYVNQEESVGSTVYR